MYRWLKANILLLILPAPEEVRQTVLILQIKQASSDYIRI